MLQEWLKELDGREEDALHDLLHKEVQKWSHNCVDVDALQRRVVRAEETCRILSKKVSALQTQLQQMQLEKLNNYNLEDREKMTVLGTKQSPKMSSNAEDEGISSSERSSSPENTKHQPRTSRQKANVSPADNDQETTIDDVIEELRIIVKDAEEEIGEEKSHEQNRIDRTDQGFYNCEDSAKIKLHRTESKVSLDNSEAYVYDKVLKRDRQTETKISKSNTGSNVSQSVIKGEQVTYFGNDRDYSTDSSGGRRLNDEARRVSKSSVEGSVKIVVKGPDVEEAIVPTILHPQPPRKSPPCLSAIMAVRHCDFIDQEEAFNSHDEDIENETLGDGSDSLLSASRLKYNGKSQTFEGQMKNTEVDHFQKQFNRKETESGNDRKLKKSFDDLRRFSGTETKDKKTIRNYETSCNAKNRTTNEAKSNNRHDYGVSQRHSSKYRSEVEKRKLLRRSASHDYLESSASSPRSKRSGKSRVESHIRKFESLNSFDEHRSLQNYGRLGSSENLRKQEFFSEESSRSRMRRSESFHHVSHVARKDQCSSQGGSDSGLFYITDFNLEPLVTRKPRSIEAPKSPNLLTKSLDRIDEGLDSMIDIVITEEKSQWSSSKYQSKTKKSREERMLIRSKSSRLEDSKSCFELGFKARKEETKSKHLKSDEFYSGHVSNKQLRSDELYEEQRNREWNEINCSRKNELDLDCTQLMLVKNSARHNSFCQNENISNRFLNKSMDSGIFAGRTYDTFGLGKSRFNAGKYSGNQQMKESPIGRRNTTSSAGGNRGKVTDVVSGLY